jgi:hypothetical protein
MYSISKKYQLLFILFGGLENQLGLTEANKGFPTLLRNDLKMDELIVNTK